MDYVDLTKQLRDAGLGDYVGAIMAYAQPCIRLRTRRAEEDAPLPLGSTRIGGLPDMPPGVEWLTLNGRPREFVAQINLSEVAPFDKTGVLPDNGLLLFFYQSYFAGGDGESEQHDAILFYDGDLALLTRTNYPTELKDWQRYPPCTVTIETDWILPTSGTGAMNKLLEDVFNSASHTHYSYP